LGEYFAVPWVNGFDALSKDRYSRTITIECTITVILFGYHECARLREHLWDLLGLKAET
jgi:hypothetical protein